MVTTKDGSTTRHIGVRFPTELDDRIRDYASAGEMSYTEALVALVQRGFGDNPAPPKPANAQVLERLDRLESILLNALNAPSRKTRVSLNALNGDATEPVAVPRKRTPYRRSLTPPATPGLAALCEAHGIESQRDLEKRTGLPQSSTRKYWLDENLPAEALARIMAALDANAE